MKTHTFPQLVRESSSSLPQRKSDLGGDSIEGVRGTGADGVTGAALNGPRVGTGVDVVLCSFK